MDIPPFDDKNPEELAQEDGRPVAIQWVMKMYAGEKEKLLAAMRGQLEAAYEIVKRDVDIPPSPDSLAVKDAVSDKEIFNLKIESDNSTIFFNTPHGYYAVTISTPAEGSMRLTHAFSFVTNMEDEIYAINHQFVIGITYSSDGIMLSDEVLSVHSDTISSAHLIKKESVSEDDSQGFDMKLRYQEKELTVGNKEGAFLYYPKKLTIETIEDYIRSTLEYYIQGLLRGSEN